MVFKVHGVILSPNVVRVIAALNEKGINYEFVPVNLGSGAHKKPEFLAINPFGEVPAAEDGEIKLFESRAINRYIVTQYKETGIDLLPKKSRAQLAAVEVWLEVESHQLSPTAGKIIFELFFKPMLGRATDPAAVETESAKMSKILDVYENHLSKNNYLAGDEYTLADVNSVPSILYLLKTSKAELITSRPHLKAWWDVVSARPAWKKTVDLIPFPQ